METMTLETPAAPVAPDTPPVAPGFGADVNELLDLVGALKDENSALKGALDAARMEHDRTKGELSNAKAMLANPAFEDARRPGSPGPGHDGGAVGGMSGYDLTPAEARTAYATLTEPASKAAFRRQHWKALGISEEH